MKLAKLYKKTSTGKIQEWQIEVEGNKYTTISGQVDGKKIVSEPTYCTPKNVGRANATTAEQQAQAEAVARWEKQQKKGYVESIEDAMKGGVNKEFVSGGFNPMLAQRYDKHGHKIEYPAYVQPKLDGIRGCLHNGQMYSRTRKEINAVPHVLEALDKIGALNIALDGELYNHEFKEDFEKISSAVRKEKEESEWRPFIQYHVYDFYSEDLPFKERMKVLHDLEENARSRNITQVQFVPSYFVDEHDQVLLWHERFTNEGFEGAIVRNAHGIYEPKRSFHLQKVKVFQDAEFKIVGIEEGKGKLKGHVGAFVCEISDEHGVRNFKAKAKGEQESLRRYFEDESLWKDKWLTVEFLNYTVKSKVPRHGIGTRIRDLSF